jgi:hypothetical protein
MKLTSRWTQLLKDVENKKEFLVAHEPMLEVIRNLVSEELIRIEKEIFEEEYELEFATKQIDRFGQRRALKRILTLIED